MSRKIYRVNCLCGEIPHYLKITRKIASDVKESELLTFFITNMPYIITDNREHGSLPAYVYVSYSAVCI